ncbi:DNA-directed RNA polymerase IV subunit [Sesamum alatum]|uniref:DNA-directed RNA polymerase n=1 Tax=Sesamum alatum TaxID=300844 RepID=A0AAE1YSK0_9LAMI|nr:DNA-directed RNA polymerase IV subunit [Sesamum alatum]
MAQAEVTGQRRAGQSPDEGRSDAGCGGGTGSRGGRRSRRAARVQARRTAVGAGARVPGTGLSVDECGCSFPGKILRAMDNDLHVVQQVRSARLKGIRLDILSDEDAGKISAMVINTVNEVSDAAFGLPTSNASECLTCGARTSKDCEGHFGLINFPFTILNPYFMSEVAQILNKICPGCKSVRHSKFKKVDSTSRHHQPRSCRYCAGRPKDGYPKMKFKVSSKDVFAKTAIIAEVNEALLNKNSDRGLAPDYWDVIPKDSAQEYSGLPSNKRVLLPAQVYSILKHVCPRVLEALLKRKNSIFLNCLLVTPNSHRVREFGQRITIIRSEKLSSLEKIYEKQSANDSASSASGLKNIKELLLGKRTDHSFRMVVVGDPRIKVDEIGLPFQIAENVLISDHINLWNWDRLEPCCDFMLYRKGNFSVLRNGQRICIWSKDMLRTGDAICRPLIDGDIVLINRPPSIHQHSLLALSVRILPINSVVSINPLICSPLRGDFDGDCLHGYVPQSVTSRVELNELVSLNKQLHNGQNGQNLLSLSQDSLTAAYLFLEDGVLLNKPEMQQLQMFCSFMPILPAIIKSTSEAAWTGKQLFGLLLPPDFEFAYASNDVCIRQGELVSCSHGSAWLRDSCDNLFQCLLRHCREKALDFLHAAQEVLCEWLSRRGLSVSLSDLYLSSNLQSRKNILDEIYYGLLQAEKLSDISLLMVDCNQDFLVESSEEHENMENFLKEHMSMAQQTKAELFQASISASKSVFWDMQNLVYKYSDKNNSFIAMLKAGSKGNLQKLVQHSMCLGLQHSLAPLSFSVPRHLSCASWNNQKNNFTVHKLHNSHETTDSYIPCSIVANSYLAGLNPLESFVLSLTTRDSSFSGHADVSGTLTKRLMFFMRDLIIGYDGTVRSCYGNQVIQFDYCTEDTFATHSDAFMAGHPVGSLAACALSEAAYSALDQPVSALEPSPLLALKKVLECGVKRSTGCKSASLFLSTRLGRWANGSEYGALEVKDHLESVFFSDIVSEVRICFSRQTNSNTSISPWTCIFHINKAVAKKRRIKLKSVIRALSMNNECTGLKFKISLPKLQITSQVCSEADIDKTSHNIIYISAALTESLKEFSDLDILRDMVIPVLLRTVIKGFLEFKKVDILWKDDANHTRFPKRPSGELYLRVVMSEFCDRTKFWSILKDKCLRIRNIIDWERSYPDDIHDYSEAYGIDTAWQCFVNSLHSAISDTGKTILPEHLFVTANCLSATGEFVPLNAKGLSHQRREANIHSPFSQACFLNPSDCLVKAAKMGQVDALQGSLEALSWGQTPSIGTGCQFDIMYNGTGHEPEKPTDVYTLLSNHVTCAKPNDVAKDLPVRPNGLFPNIKQRQTLVKRMVSQHFSVVGIQKISQRLKRMLKEYPMNSQLKGEDKSTAMRALQFHPRWEEKIGTGVMDIKVGRHPDHKESCFVLIRTDGTEEDFSYNKCIHHALQIVAPEKAKAYKSRKENINRNPEVEPKLLFAASTKVSSPGVWPRRFSGSSNGKAFKGYPFSCCLFIT